MCVTETTPKDFREKSFIEWDFKDQFYLGLEKALHRLHLQLMFRTRHGNGLLLKAENGQKSEYILLEVSRGQRRSAAETANHVAAQNESNFANDRVMNQYCSILAK